MSQQKHRVGLLGAGYIVDAHVKALRAKLRAIAPDEDPIQTHRGMGYSLRET